MPGLTLEQPQTIQVKIAFLAHLPRYKNEKPCVVVPPAKPLSIAGVNPPNVQKDVVDGISVEDVREWKEKLSLDEQGFQILEHESKHLGLDTKEVCEAYKAENQAALIQAMNAEKVITWSLKKRMPKKRAEGETWEFRNELEVEQPAILAHCDFTYERGRVMVERMLGEEQTQKYIDDGYRIRIINTWRPLVPVIERQPLALCDPRTVKNEHLVKCDRVLVDDLGEITLLQHQEDQKWYYLGAQKISEPYIFCTWDSNDTQFPDVARHSPHVSFDGVNIREDAPPRYSVESRSVVVTKT